MLLSLRNAEHSHTRQSGTDTSMQCVSCTLLYLAAIIPISAKATSCCICTMIVQWVSCFLLGFAAGCNDPGLLPSLLPTYPHPIPDLLPILAAGCQSPRLLPLGSPPPYLLTPTPDLLPVVAADASGLGLLPLGSPPQPPPPPPRLTDLTPTLTLTFHLFAAGCGVQHGLQAHQGEVQAQCQGCAGVRGERSGPCSGCAQGSQGPRAPSRI